eukprot:352440-Chlamydomonas_euryale.AAC.1
MAVFMAVFIHSPCGRRQTRTSRPRSAARCRPVPARRSHSVSKGRARIRIGTWPSKDRQEKGGGEASVLARGACVYKRDCLKASVLTRGACVYERDRPEGSVLARRACVYKRDCLEGSVLAREACVYKRDCLEGSVLARRA